MQIGTGQVLDGSSRGLNTASMPADRTQANQGVGNRFRCLYETLLPENLGKHCGEWPAGKTESEIKLLIQENSKPQDLIVYTVGSVTKDQSRWGFTVKLLSMKTVCVIFWATLVSNGKVWALILSQF